jgi:hypothetical protein
MAHIALRRWRENATSHNRTEPPAVTSVLLLGLKTTKVWALLKVLGVGGAPTVLEVRGAPTEIE